MSFSGQSLIDLSNFSPDSLFSLFERAESALKGQIKPVSGGQFISLVFFENSTRTRLSFEAAAYKLGLRASYFDSSQGTSLNKGESLEEALRTIGAMNPDLIVLRADGEFPLFDLATQINTPIINGGWGAKGHPTQALLDLFSLWRHWGGFHKKKLVFAGDILHSRVVSSHIEIANLLGVEVGYCAPKHLVPDISPVQRFANIGDAAEWADAIMCLRVQKERHSKNDVFALEDYRRHYSVTSDRLKEFKEEILFMHPGPFNLGVEIDEELLSDERCIIREQITNGVYLRAALINEILNLGAI